MDTTICLKCNKIINKDFKPKFIHTDYGRSKRVIFIDFANENKICCEPKGEVGEFNFKKYGLLALLLFEAPDCCPFKLEHTVYDGYQREKDLEMVRK